MNKFRLHPIPLIPILFLIFMSGTIFIPSTLCSAQGLQNDANSGGDAGDQINGAIPIEQGTYEGVLFDSTDMRDFYQLDLAINSTIKVTLHHQGVFRDIYSFFNELLAVYWTFRSDNNLSLM